MKLEVIGMHLYCRCMYLLQYLCNLYFSLSVVLCVKYELHVKTVEWGTLVFRFSLFFLVTCKGVLRHAVTLAQILWSSSTIVFSINTLNAELNPICHLLALLGAHHILHVSRIRVKTHCSGNWVFLQHYKFRSA